MDKPLYIVSILNISYKPVYLLPSVLINIKSKLCRHLVLKKSDIIGFSAPQKAVPIATTLLIFGYRGVIERLVCGKKVA